MQESRDDSTRPPGVGGSLKSERIGARLTGTQVDVRLSALPGWQAVDGDAALRRTFELLSFRAAIAFAAYIVEVAEAMDHRPGVELRDNKVTLTLTTHPVGGLTDKDFVLAAKIYA